MSRYFEKISFDQFKNDVSDDKAMYENYSLPKRSTINSAGYDFEALYDFVIKPGQIKKIPLGIKASMNSNEVLLLLVRSSQGFKYNVRMCNQVGVIDSDYYGADNYGHIMIKIVYDGDGNNTIFSKLVSIKIKMTYIVYVILISIRYQ